MCETLWTPEHMYQHGYIQVHDDSNGVVKTCNNPSIVPQIHWWNIVDGIFIHDKIHTHSLRFGYPLASLCHNYRFNLESLMSFVVSLLPFELKACNLNFVALQVEYIMRYECRVYWGYILRTMCVCIKERSDFGRLDIFSEVLDNVLR